MTEFCYETNYIYNFPHSIKVLVDDTIKKSKLYLEFLQNFELKEEFVNITFKALDEERSEDSHNIMIKWEITFEPSNENVIEFKGYNRSIIYELINKKTNETIFKGNYYAINDFVNNEKFEKYSQEDLDREFKTDSYIIDEIEECVGNIFNFKTFFNYSISEEDYEFQKNNK